MLIPEVHIRFPLALHVALKHLGQQKDSFPLGAHLPGLNATSGKTKVGSSVCRGYGLLLLPLQGLLVQGAGIQQLQYLQAMQTSPQA